MPTARTPQRLRAARRPAVTARALIAHAEQRLARARLHYGHGTDNPRDEAAELVFYSAGFAHEAAPAAYAWPVGAAAQRELQRLLAARIRSRTPAAYLTGRTWFAGHEIRIDRRVLVPRSPLAEFIREGGTPFLAANRVRRILDLGTGSGCIAIACAHAFARATVDATDVARGALAVAAENVRRHALGRRIELIESDVYDALGARRYDMIISNPPYVPAAQVKRLPAEYRREPGQGLRAGRDGLRIVRRILRGASAHLRPRGVLVVEVGDGLAAVERAWPTLPFLWLSFESGAGSVFLLTREQLRERRAALGA
jgi:ribosomal protein L3 glutamine methyltransferase